MLELLGLRHSASIDLSGWSCSKQKMWFLVLEQVCTFWRIFPIG